MQTYPFPRAKPAGWAFGEILTDTQMNIVDANAAQAADGLAWSDLAAARTWQVSASLSGAQTAIDAPYADGGHVLLEWRAAGTSDASWRSFAGGATWRGPDTIAALPTTPKAAAANAAGGVVFGGDNGASAAKYAYSTTGTNGTFSAGTSSNASTPIVNTLEWIGSGIDLFVAGLSSGLIETSPTGETWTARTTPNSEARGQIVGNGADLLLAASSASTDKYLTSINAVDWVERSFPSSSTAGWFLCHSPYWSRWFAFNKQTATLYKSTDGIAWSQVTMNFLASGPLVAVGRVLAQVHSSVSSTMAMLLSVDEGATWRPGPLFAGTAVRWFGRSPFRNQMILITGGDVVHTSLPIADPTQPTYL